MPYGHAVPFVGREGELLRLRSLLQEVKSGFPRHVLVEGPGGIGKSSLVRHFLLEHRNELRLLRASGDDNESELSFGMLAQLIATPTSFSAWEGSHDPVSAGLQLLDLIGSLQDNGPVVMVVDDVQWADVPSLQALTFALRRLRADRVLTIVIARDLSHPRLPSGLRRLLTDDQTARVTVTGLGVADMQTLAQAFGAGTLHLGAAARLCHHTRGNPLHARELLEQVSKEILADLSHPLPVPRTYTRLVLGRLAACAPATRDMVAAASVLGLSAPLHLVAQLSGSQKPLAALDEAVEAGLLVEHPRRGRLSVAFPHPLTHAAIYQNTGIAVRADLHERAAELTDNELDRLRHRLRAATRSDGRLSADLTFFAREEARAGRWSSAATQFVNAASVAPSDEERARRTAEAITALVYAGRVGEATDLARGLPLSCPPDIRCFALGVLEHVRGNASEAVRLLTEAWQRCDVAAHPVRATRISEQLAILWSMAGRGAEGVRWAERAIGRAAEVPSLDFIRLIHLTALGCDGRAGEALAMVRVLPTAGSASTDELDQLLGRAMLRMWTDDLAGAVEDAGAALSRSEGRSVPYRVSANCVLGEAEFRAGRWDDAAAHTAVGASLAEDSDQLWLAGIACGLAALVPGARGLFPEADAYVTASAALATNATSITYVAYAHAWIATARGDAAMVVNALAPVLDLPYRDTCDGPGIAPWQDLFADACSRLGEYGRARAVLDAFEERAADQERHSSLSLIARARGNLLAAQGGFDEAEICFETGLRHDALVDLPFDQARLNLDYGIFLRRRGTRGAAADRLEAAHQVLERLQAVPYLTRCERELAACGRVIRSSSMDPRSGLTPQEHAIARLVATGLSNQQVARELMLSVKTIEYHLGHVFTKLGLRSRTALAARLAAQEP
ncbi:AAA family ATPase [Nonomuraea glycinis]|uniref:LuxR family transcriptional regulator n=1 Tax=Nonomuraea glycinis TaxID=2047744 RepID=A0A918AEJ5_9ACTN|nr:LuxR family transcriptional regulator [Nonomuraea glycinis]MCA2183235.1 AAA family ATPase [Nonomuraea glycinis]GGP18215.1 LuxR family transcriptional regulator [Nonomuraea glycinis]